LMLSIRSGRRQLNSVEGHSDINSATVRWAWITMNRIDSITFVRWAFSNALSFQALSRSWQVRDGLHQLSNLKITTLTPITQIDRSSICLLASS
jgi:hypothetical protein